MNPRTALIALGAGLLVALAAPGAVAGQTCQERPLSPATVHKAFALAHKTREALDASGAEVVLLARAGQDLSRWGLRYSHLGYAWRDHPSGRWRVLHELNACGTASSALFVEGLANFFADDLFHWETLVLVPEPATQQRLAALFRAGQAARLHDPDYSMVAYAFGTRYQNSNQWAIETAADALQGPLTGRAEAQAWLKAAGYTPTTVALGAGTRLGGRLFRANVAFDDHPDARRYAGQIDTVTVESVYAWWQRREPQARRLLVTLGPA